MKKLGYTFFLVVCFSLSTSACMKITTVGFEGSNITPGVARDGMDHSEELAYNCATTAENMSRDNPNARVECQMDTRGMSVTHDPRYRSADPPAPYTARPNPPTSSGPPPASGNTPPVNPRQERHRVTIINTSSYLKTIEVFTQQGNNRQTFASFNLSPGQERVVYLPGGTYNVRIEGDPGRQDTTMVVSDDRTYEIN